MIPYENCIIGGPYVRKQDGRSHILAYYPDKTKKTVSYPKYLMECYLGRYLLHDETVDHIDGDFRNNKISNMQVLPRRIHASLDDDRLKPMQFVCPECNKCFELSGGKLSQTIKNRNTGKAGPFCGRSCAGRYGAKVQNGVIDKLEVVPIIAEYYRITKR